MSSIWCYLTSCWWSSIFKGRSFKQSGKYDAVTTVIILTRLRLIFLMVKVWNLNYQPISANFQHEAAFKSMVPALSRWGAYSGRTTGCWPKKGCILSPGLGLGLTGAFVTVGTLGTTFGGALVVVGPSKLTASSSLKSAQNINKTDEGFIFTLSYFNFCSYYFSYSSFR